MVKPKPAAKTKLVRYEENAYGEVILTLKRGHEEKEIVVSETGLAGIVYENASEYYLGDLHWSQKQFDNYWENGGEEKECDNYISIIVDNYDDDSTWEEI